MVDFFIGRPVFATVCALLIILGGTAVRGIDGFFTDFPATGVRARDAAEQRPL